MSIKKRFIGIADWLVILNVSKSTFLRMRKMSDEFPKPSPYFSDKNVRWDTQDPIVAKYIEESTVLP